MSTPEAPRRQGWPSRSLGGDRAAAFWTMAVLAASLVLLAVMVVSFGFRQSAAESAAMRLTQAEWLLAEAETGGFSAPPRTVDSHALPGTWQPVELPFAPPIALVRQARDGLSPAATRVSWLRIATRGLPPDVGALALFARRIKTDGTVAVYANGQLVHRAQEEGPLWNSTRTPLWVVLERMPGEAPLEEVLLRLEHTRNTQVAVSSLWAGPEESLRDRYNRRLWLQQDLPVMFNAAFLALGMFALFVWLRRRRETIYLLFFTLAIASFLRGLHFYVAVPIANDWFAWLTVNSLFWLVAVVHFALRQLHRRRLRWLTAAVVAITVLVGVLTLPWLSVLRHPPQVTPLIYFAGGAMAAAVALVGGISAWRRSNEGRLVAVGIALCVLLGASDWLLQNNFSSPEGWYMGAYTNAVTFCVFGVLMYRRYVNAIGEVERVNAGLAERLQAREAELDASHRRLREIERLQTIGDERRRLMQDMHDGLGSSLISAIRSVEGGGMKEGQVSELLKSCLEDLKLAIDSMEPLEDDLLLLLATLRYRLAPRLESSGVALQWNVQELPPLDWLDPSSALHILRIVQESIGNILRHTRATEIRLSAAPEAAGVCVRIEDNGQGFDAGKALECSGARGMRNQMRRAQAVGGSVSWQSGAQGTVFTFWLPLRRGGDAAG